MTKSHTEHSNYRFVAKEFADGTPWLVLERQGKGLEVLGSGILGFELADGASLQDAELLASSLNQSISQVSFTSFYD
jgi:hypothetical protein